MPFLADESCDFAVVRALRLGGHDVLAVGEFQQRSIDSELMDVAYKERRILLTEDKDFLAGWPSWLIWTAPGSSYIRFPAGARQTLAASAARLVADFGAKLIGAFVVVRPGSVRISAAPSK